MVTKLHLPHAIVVRLHVRKSNVVILTPETAVTVGVCEQQPILVGRIFHPGRAKSNQLHAFERWPHKQSCHRLSFKRSGTIQYKWALEPCRGLFPWLGISDGRRLYVGLAVSP